MRLLVHKCTRAVFLILSYSDIQRMLKETENDYLVLRCGRMKRERNERDPKGRVFSRATVQSVVWELDKTSARFHQNCQGKNSSTNPKLQKNSKPFPGSVGENRACLSVTQVKLIEIPTQRSPR